MIDPIHEGAVVEVSLEKDGFNANLLLKRESGRIQVVPVAYDFLVQLKDELAAIIPAIQDELAADIDSENEQLRRAEEEFIHQKETEAELRYDREHPYDP